MVHSTGRSTTSLRRAAFAAGVAAILVTGMPSPVRAGGQDEGKRVKRDVMMFRTESGGGMTAELVEAARQAPTLQVIPYDNPADAPLAITSAELKSVPAEQFAAAPMGDAPRRFVFKQRRVETEDGVAAEPRILVPADGELRVKPFPSDADGNVTVMLVTVTNVSNQAIEQYQFGGTTEADGKKTVRFFFHKTVEPGASETFAIPVFGDRLQSGDVVLKPVGARYADGTTWGEVTPHDRMVIVRQPAASGEVL